ncbi:MAG: carboxypeptidase regulatory-like domain-containing protein [Chlorobiales bacterium]|nr:carboxypeptidase regulatory-like domain-containing protein [Chlorobiales bacterium]
MIHRFGLALLLLMLASLELYAQGRLLGRISDNDGNPVVAAVVSLSGEKMTGAAISNSQGYYTFLSIPEGNYKIRAIKSGQQTRQYDVLLADKTTIMMNLKLASGEKTETPQPASAKELALAPVTEKKIIQKPVAAKEEKPKKPKETVVAKAPDKSETQPAKHEDAVSQPQKEAVPSPRKESAAAEAQPEIITAEIKDENLRKLVKQTEASEELSGKAVEKRVSIEGGMETIYKYLQYPPSARNTNKAVTVVAKVYVDQNGNASRVDMLRKAQEVFNEEVYRVLTEDIKFVPAQVDAKPVPSVMTIIVNYAP